MICLSVFSSIEVTDKHRYVFNMDPGDSHSSPRSWQVLLEPPPQPRFQHFIPAKGPQPVSVGSYLCLTIY